MDFISHNFPLIEKNNKVILLSQRIPIDEKFALDSDSFYIS